MKPKVQLILRYNLGFIGFLVVFHRPGCQLHNLAVPYLGYYILLSLSKAMCNLIYEKFTIYKQLLNPWFESSLFFFIFFFPSFFQLHHWFVSLALISGRESGLGLMSV